MKLKTNTYHNHLINDKKRTKTLLDAITNTAKNTKNKNLAIDLGCGSGILTIQASKHYKKVIGIENNPEIIPYTKENTQPYKNITIQKINAINYNYTEQPDLIICEMLDTALIDEEQALTLNNIPQNIKNNTKIIPCGIINKIQPINMENTHIIYEDTDYHPNYKIIGQTTTYDKINFKKQINTKFKKEIKLKITENNTLNGIKIITETIITPNKTLEPTPMLNPPLLIPLKNPQKVEKNTTQTIQLNYKMGHGLETIKTKIIKKQRGEKQSPT